MNTHDLETLKSWFADYAATFYTEDQDHNLALNIKTEHTLQVCENTLMIGTALGMSPQDLIIAETAALFHDLGRFKQYKEYGTFSDRRSTNHAKLGLREMAAHKLLAVCTTAEKELIAKAVYHHNTAKPPTKENARTLHFIRLLRDADKLDIWNLFLKYLHAKNNHWHNALVLDLPDTPEVSDRFIEALCSQTIAPMETMKTLNDFKLLQIGWVYDLNFEPSFQMAADRNIIERFEAALPRSKEITAAVRRAKDYVNMRLGR